MPRKQSHRIRAVQQQLEDRLRSSPLRAGDRFLSAREVAAEFGISYQTAHRLLNALCDSGLVERRSASGTFLPGGGDSAPTAKTPYESVQLFFDVRARRTGSFGARLLRGLGQRLRRERILWEVIWTDTPHAEAAAIPPHAFPVLWQDRRTLERCRAEGRPALLLNERPAPGLSATFLDSVSIDDYFGGVCAAQYLRGRGGREKASFAAIAGPADDERSRAREAGFRSILPGAAVFSAGGWFREDGLRVAGEAVQRGADGLFCCNDRLAEAVVSYCQSYHLSRPPLIGFDNAPVSQALNITTVAIPWEEFLSDAAGVLRTRIAGDLSAARQHIVTPFLVIRDKAPDIFTIVQQYKKGERRRFMRRRSFCQGWIR